MTVRQILLLLLTSLGTIQLFSQIDTLTYIPHDTEFEIKGKKSKYLVDHKPATKSEYEKAKAQTGQIGNCKPCWLRYIDKFGQLVYEGDFYEDCCIGTYVERYSNGKLKVKGQYRTPSTKIPDYNKGDCRQHGDWVYYKITGDIEKTEVYKDGVLIK